MIYIAVQTFIMAMIAPNGVWHAAAQCGHFRTFTRWASEAF